MLPFRGTGTTKLNKGIISFLIPSLTKQKAGYAREVWGVVRNEAANTRINRIVISISHCNFRCTVSFYRNYKYMVYMVYKYIS